MISLPRINGYSFSVDLANELNSLESSKWKLIKLQFFFLKITEKYFSVNSIKFQITFESQDQNVSNLRQYKHKKEIILKRQHAFESKIHNFLSEKTNKQINHQLIYIWHSEYECMLYCDCISYK